MRNRYPGRWKRLEQLLIRLVILCAVILVVIQSFFVTDPMRHVIGYVDLEDVKVSPNSSQQLVPGEPVITFFLNDFAGLPKMSVLVNGEPVGKFNDRYVTIQVQEGDLIEIDATFYDRPVEIQVLSTSENIQNPPEGKTFKVTGITSLDKVKIHDNPENQP